MPIFKFLDPFFHALSDGKIIRITVAWVLRISAAITALVGLLGAFFIVGLAFKATEYGIGTRSAGLMIGFVLLALVILAWGYLSAGVLVFRANSVIELGDSHFTVLSIVSLLFRLNGELIFVLYSLLGVGGCLFFWFTDFSPLNELGMLGEEIPFVRHTGTGFLGGIEFGVLFLLIAFVGIVVSYALAELSVVLVEIALNTRGMLTTSILTAGTPAPALPATPAPVPPPIKIEALPAPVQRKCPKCGTAMAPGVTFCEECGAKVD